MSAQESRAVHAAVLTLAGRAIGFGWALALIHAIGVDEYGAFASGLAAGAVISVPIDAYFLVRAPRVSDEEFRQDRATRTLLALVLIIAGLVALPFAPIVGLALGVPGATIMLSAATSQAIRDGHPERAGRAELLRQVLSVSLGVLVVSLLGHDELGWIVPAYLLGYLPVVLLTLRHLRTARPARPDLSRRSGFIVLDAVGGALYLSGDIVLVGLVADHAAAGRYAIGAMIVTTVAAIGMNYGATFHERLRAAGGAWQAGPPRLHVVAAASACGLLLLGGALIVGRLPIDGDLGPTLVAFSPVAATRFVSAVLTTLLVLSSTDGGRLAVTVVALVVKAASILVFAGVLDGGARGAALGYLLGDLVMIAGALALVRRKAPAS